MLVGAGRGTGGPAVPVIACVVIRSGILSVAALGFPAKSASCHSKREPPQLLLPQPLLKVAFFILYSKGAKHILVRKTNISLICINGLRWLGYISTDMLTPAVEGPKII